MTMTDDIEKHPLAKRFNRLTPDQVLHAVEELGKRCTGRFIILNSYENRVYQLEMEDDSWVVGKFYRPGRWSQDTIRAEHDFVQELADDEVPAVCPLTLASGETIGEVDGILFALFPRVGGRNPEEFDDEQLAIVGRLVARMHNIGARKDAPHRMRLDAVTYGWNNLSYLMENDLVPEEARPNYEATARLLIQRIEPLFGEVPYHRIHGDCHLGNLLWTTQSPKFLDFDDMVVGPAAQDIWMLVPSFDSEGQRQRQVLLEAYRQFRHFDDSWIKLIEPLRALRYIHYSTWVARRWEDPTFQRTFTHFGSVQYWQNETQDLREQMVRIEEALDAGVY